MFNVSNQQGNASWNHNGYHLSPVRVAIIKKQKTNVGEDVENWNPWTKLVGM